MAAHVLQGTGASPGIAIGQAFVCASHALFPSFRHLPAADIEAEVERLRAAFKMTESQLIYWRQKLPEEELNLLEAHGLMLADPLFADAAIDAVRSQAVNAEWAVYEVTQALLARFASLQNPYFRERQADVKWVADRVQQNLAGQAFLEEEEALLVPEGAIVVADELHVAKAVFLATKKKALAFVTQGGGETSHTSIVARAKQVPAVVGVHNLLQHIKSGDWLVIDGEAGEVYVAPDEETLKRAKQKQQHWHAQQMHAQHQAHGPTFSQDGQRVALLGNMEFVEEVDMLLKMGAEGVGLFRTEFLLVGQDTCSEETQFLAYCRVLEAMQGRPVTLRTFDLGADKLPEGTQLLEEAAFEKEANPALGLRGIRLCLANRALFRAQLRAALRASVHGKLQLMFPLISCFSEFREARQELEACKAQLAAQGVTFDKHIPVGMMIETPAAAWIADRLATEADFFSVGTNDLIQYTLAIDRQNAQVAYLYHPMHLAVLRSLRQVVLAAKSANIPLAVCGEIAGTPPYVSMLLGLGFDTLSMAAVHLGKVKECIQHTSVAALSSMVEAALQKNTAEEIEALLRGQTERTHH